MISNAQAAAGLVFGAIPIIVLMLFAVREGPEVGPRDYAGCAVAFLWLIKWTVALLIIGAVCLAASAYFWELW